jgi:IMP dehydrogenase
MIRSSLSFDDLLVCPRYSKTRSRKEISLKTRLTKNISLNLPLISSPMDTITEERMAIAMAISGGLGIIHRYCTIERQVEMVKSVKRYLEFIIGNPFTLNENDTVSKFQEKAEKVNVYSYIVLDSENKLSGIVTKRDIQSCLLANDNNNTILIKDIMTPLINLIFVNNGITREKAVEIMSKHKIEKLPVIDNDFNVTGLITFKNLYNYQMNKHIYSLDQDGNLLVGAAMGTLGDDFLPRAKALVDAKVDVLCIDVASGHNQSTYDCIKKIKELYPDICIISGNVVTPEGFDFLASAGCSGIRIGIGNGAACSTRATTGCGMGQASAVLACKKISGETDTFAISDGGNTGKSGNMCKALLLGANVVMLGKTLAATDETPGKLVYRNGKKVKIYRGMASTMAMMSKSESMNKDFESSKNSGEGVDFEVECKGSALDILEGIRSSIQSGFSYVGCSSIEELKSVRDDIVFYQQTSIGMNETNVRISPA